MQLLLGYHEGNNNVLLYILEIRVLCMGIQHKSIDIKHGVDLGCRNGCSEYTVGIVIVPNKIDFDIINFVDFLAFIGISGGVSQGQICNRGKCIGNNISRSTGVGVKETVTLPVMTSLAV